MVYYGGGMTGKQKGRMTLDLTMTVLSLILMGGSFFFPWDGVHEILGTVLLALWALHVVLNRRWYRALFKGHYNPYRLMQAVVNMTILVCAVALMVSGIMLSNHVFAFLHIYFGAGFARTLHLLASHWYFICMSLHIGMHVSMIFRQLAGKKSADGQNVKSAARRLIMRIVLLAICGYGVYSFITRNIGKYLFLTQPFFFLDIDRGYVLFFTDYLSIVVLIAVISHYLATFLTVAGKHRSHRGN
jgi:hypothetical protein